MTITELCMYLLKLHAEYGDREVRIFDVTTGGEEPVMGHHVCPYEGAIHLTTGTDDDSSS